jgi:hypothetical protein
MQGFSGPTTSACGPRRLSVHHRGSTVHLAIHAQCYPQLSGDLQPRSSLCPWNWDPMGVTVVQYLSVLVGAAGWLLGVHHDPLGSFSRR